MVLKTSKRIKYRLLFIVIFAIIVFISNLIVNHIDIEELMIFNSTGLLTYFGLLIGFSLTIYTFGMSMIVDIKSNIQKMDKLSNSEKNEMYDELIDGFAQIKENIWIMFFALIIVVFVSFAKNMINPFGWHVEDYLIPETMYLALFILSTLAMMDIMKTLFNLSEINLLLIRKSKTKE